MKKLFLVGALALFSSMNAQGGFNIGAHVGLPLGGAKTSSVAAGLDLAYRFPIADKFFIGPATGYQAMIGKEVDYGTIKYKYKTTSIVPIVASAVYKFTDQFGVGLDLGYGIAFGGDISQYNNGSGWEDYNGSDYDYDYGNWGSLYGAAFSSATKAKGAFIWAPKAYYSFGKSSVWAGFQGLSMYGSTGTFNVGYSYSLK